MFDYYDDIPATEEAIADWIEIRYGDVIRQNDEMGYYLPTETPLAPCTQSSVERPGPSERFDFARSNAFRRNCGRKAPRWWEGRCRGSRKTARDRRATIRTWSLTERFDPLESLI